MWGFVLTAWGPGLVYNGFARGILGAFKWALGLGLGLAGGFKGLDEWKEHGSCNLGFRV